MEAVDIAFAEEARIVCSRALVQLAIGQHGAVEEILTEFGQKCVRIVQGAKMAQEQADLQTDRFDLASLKVDLRSEAPEIEAD
jgi:hypothetical protein